MSHSEAYLPIKHASQRPSMEHAVVLGASMAGLLAARVLSEHFQCVTLIERDLLPTAVENRGGVPQGRHLHVLLVKGEQILSQLFPGLVPDLIEAGAVRIDIPGDVRWFQEEGYKIRFRSGTINLNLELDLARDFFTFL